MKTLLEAMHNLKEAKPSALKKTRNTDQDIHYEPSEGDYEYVPFDYVLHGGDYEGYIDDKKGNKYKVVASRNESDTGKIAGGTTYYRVTIAYGEHEIKLSDYTAVFSRNDGAGYRLFTDLEDGMYLEDYLQKNLRHVNGVSNIEDWKKDKEANGEKIESYKIGKVWVQENIIRNNEDYDERTSFQKRVDKKNEKDFVNLSFRVPIYIDGNNIKIAKSFNTTKYKYTGNKGYSKFISTEDSVEVKKDTPLLLKDVTIERIIKMATTRGQYDFEITLEDLRNVTLELDSLDTTFQITNKGLKIVYRDFKDMETVTVHYRPKEGYNRFIKLEELAEKAKIKLDWNFSLPKIYREIQSRLGGAKESIVEIVYDYGKHEYRAQGDDGEHGKAWVQFPKDLRQRDKKYKVDQLIWNGKNYRAKGNIEEV